jgi:hypothetical protein
MAAAFFSLSKLGAASFLKYLHSKKDTPCKSALRGTFFLTPLRFVSS